MNLKNISIKKIVIMSCTLGALLGFGISMIGNTELGSADSYPSHYLHAQNEIRTVSVNYWHGNSAKSCNQSMDRKVNGYLHSIKNVKDYKVSVRPASVGDSGQYYENVLTDIIQLTRK